MKKDLYKLEQKVSQLETRDAEDKFELLKEIHRIRENTVKNLVAIVGTLIAIFSDFGFFYLLPQVVTNVIKTSADSEIRALGESTVILPWTISAGIWAEPINSGLAMKSKSPPSFYSRSTPVTKPRGPWLK